jgi:hypothetical protein
MNAPNERTDAPLIVFADDSAHELGRADKKPDCDPRTLWADDSNTDSDEQE